MGSLGAACRSVALPQAALAAVVEATEAVGLDGDLARHEGVFVEPASAAGVAGLLAEHAAGRLDPGQTVVVTVTGHGLKDVDTALDAFGAIEETVVPVDPHAAAGALGLR